MLRDVKDPVDFLFLDNDFGNYFRAFRPIEPRLSDGALILADNAGVGAGDMAGYLSYVRSRFRSECRWFDTSLPWAERDAMEITEYRSRRFPSFKRVSGAMSARLPIRSDEEMAEEEDEEYGG